MSLQATLTLNNRAVELFHSNYIPQAVKTYYESLSIVKELLNSPQEEGRFILSPTESQSAVNVPPQHECFHASTRLSSNIPARSSTLFLYQNALMLKESASSFQNVTQSMHIYCAAIMFNAGLLHHLHSMQTGKSAPLNRAQQLYQWSLQLLAGLATSNDTITLLAVANTNNLAHIHLEKGLVMEAGHRLQILSQLLHTSQPTIRRILTVDEIEGLLSNTLSGQGMNSSVAA